MESAKSHQDSSYALNGLLRDFTKNTKCQSQIGARGKLTRLPKSVGFLFLGP